METNVSRDREYHEAVRSVLLRSDTGTNPWRHTSYEVDVPKDAWAVWVWFLDTVPAAGLAWFDEVSFEVLGPATGVIGPSPSAPSAPAATKPPAIPPGRQKH